MSNDRYFLKRAAGALLLALLPAMLPCAAMADTKVGVASVVNGEPLAKPPSGNERVLHIGNDMTASEVVTTKANDRAHIIFLDGSSLTVGPNSVITIDKFVYDPEKRTGTLSMDAGRGVFRYVGGAISKNSEVQIKARGATMGIRGGIAAFTIAPNGTLTAYFLFGGSLSVTAGGQTQTATQPGTQISVTPGGVPTPPSPIPPGILRQIMVALQLSPGSNAPGAPPRTAVGNALGNSNLHVFNSDMSPEEALAAIAEAQDVQLSLFDPGVDDQQQGRGQQQGNGPLQNGDPVQGTPPAPNQDSSQQADNQQQGNGPQQGSNPLQGAGPVQGTGPLQGMGPEATDAGQQGNGPLETAAPLQGTGPLQASDPQQAAGPLQNAGPLAAASPLQETGPIGGPGNLAFNVPPPVGDIPNVPVQQVGFIPAALGGNPTANQQLQNLLGTPQGNSPDTLTNLVNNIPPTPPGPPGPPPISVPTPLPPTIFNPTNPNSVSPN